MSVRANRSEASLLSLNRDTFNRILGSIKQFLKEDYCAAASQDGNKESTRHGQHDRHKAGTIVSVDGAFVLSMEDDEDNGDEVPQDINNIDQGTNSSQFQMLDLEASAISSGANNN